MTDSKYELISANFKSTTDIPKNEDLLYRCTDCGIVIPSVPADNIGCTCGNIFIDKDYWRLVVANLTKLQVVRKNSQ